MLDLPYDEKLICRCYNLGNRKNERALSAASTTGMSVSLWQTATSILRCCIACCHHAHLLKFKNIPHSNTLTQCSSHSKEHHFDHQKG
mmetsp:Transcript_32420/g.76259  ORF Transcript_32420/g.76259 Transcript_32420/m.76259 type:complete len:88 (+) Transcript_32420:818-1081(+)